MTKQEKAKLETIEIQCSYGNNKPGDTIKVVKEEAKRLIDLGVARIVK